MSTQKPYAPSPPVKRKVKIPPANELLKIQTLCGCKKKPVWVYLDKEMKQNEKIKPYNTKVGIWLRFLRELKFYNACQQKRIMKQINRECGPTWFMELSSDQKEVLAGLELLIHNDLIDDIPRRVRPALKKLGLTFYIPKDIIMYAMKNCGGDVGIFIWTLYSNIYNQSPNVLKKSYDINGRLLMSSLVAIDLEDCLKNFKRLTDIDLPVKPKKKRKASDPKKRPPHVPFYPYIQQTPKPELVIPKEPKKRKPKKVLYKFKPRSKESYDALQLDTDFIQQRKDRHSKHKLTNRRCNYKFATVSVPMNYLTAKQRVLAMKERMMKKKAFIPVRKEQRDLNQFRVGGVSYAGYKSNVVVEGISRFPPTCMRIDEGYFSTKLPTSSKFTVVSGYTAVKDPIEKKTQCECINKEGKVMDSLNKTKCRCNHWNIEKSYKRKAPTTNQYLHPPNRHGPMWLDESLVYQLDSVEEFIKKKVDKAIASNTPTPEPNDETWLAEHLKAKVIVSVLLADLAKTDLIIPHLPKANTLTCLLVWARKRIHGDFTPEQHRELYLKAQRRWIQLEHMDFRARANFIPFTKKQMENMTWQERAKLQIVAKSLMKDFTTRNRLMQMEHARLLWSTMHYNEYPWKPFLDNYFSFLPANYFNPADLNNIKKNKCPHKEQFPFGRRLTAD